MHLAFLEVLTGFIEAGAAANIAQFLCLENEDLSFLG
jgi:hypothetical protein